MSGSTMSGTDAKLVHIVKKFLSFSPAGSKPNVDHIVHCVRTQHREYHRKDLARLKRQVQKVLRSIDDDAESKKRARDGAEEEAFEKKARAHDVQRENMEMQNSSSLNAGLIERYRKVQEGRDQEARASAAAAAASQPGAPVMVIDETGPPADSITNSSQGSTRNRGSTLATGRRHTNLAPSGPSVANGAAHDGVSPRSPPPQQQQQSKTNKRKNKTMAPRRQIERSAERTSSGGKDVTNQAVPRPSERYSDLGGMDDVLGKIRQLVEYPLVRPELYKHLGIDPPRGVLLRGPPGTGKTHLANAIAGQLGVPFFRVSAPELVSGMSGESEARIRDLFQAASESAPAIVFLDELDAIAPKRGDNSGGRGMEKRMVAQLLTSLDMLDPKYNKDNAAVIVLGATNRPDSLDAALRRAGRFDKEILMGVPNETARMGILKNMTKDMKVSGGFDLKVLARKTPGYVGADIRSLTKEAAVIAINRIFTNVLADQNHPTGDQIPGAAAAQGVDISTIAPLSSEDMDPLFVTMDDFLAAIPHVQPSSTREGFATVPGVSWDDIGALGAIREELTLTVLEPIRHPEKFQEIGVPLPAGLMLYGPPGCGKTLLAKAIANESGANFISVKGPELLDKYVGESERSVRVVFERARSSSPCVVFFDELDSLCPKRGSDGGGGGGVSERVVNQLLTEMDGLETRQSVFIIAATNRPELIDPAMMRPGRLDKLLYVPLPTPNDRVSIIRALSKNVSLGNDVDLDGIGRSSKAEGYSGADCAALLREAGLSVLKEDLAKPAATADQEKSPKKLSIQARHFDYAFDHVVPSVSRKDQARYLRLRDRMANARGRSTVTEEPAPASGTTTNTSEKKLSDGPASSAPESVAAAAKVKENTTA